MIPVARFMRPVPFWTTVLTVAFIGSASLFAGWRNAEFIDVTIFTDLSRAEALIEEGAFWLDEHQPAPLAHRRATALEEFDRALLRLEDARKNISRLDDPPLQAAIAEAVDGARRLRAMAADPAFGRTPESHTAFLTEHLRTSKRVTAVTARALHLRQGILFDYQAKLAALAVATLVLTLIAFRVIVSLTRQEVNAQREYARIQERYRLMVEGVRDILFIYQTAPVRQFIYVSPGIEELMGATVEEHYRNPGLWFERVVEKELLQEALDGLHPPQTSHLFRRPVGDDFRWLEMAVTPFSSEGGGVTMLGILRDVTESQQARQRLQQERDRAEEATRMKDKFVSLVSHDIRSPLSSLLGLLTLLADRDDRFFAESGRMILEKGINAGRHLLELSNQLLGLSRMQSGEVILNREPVDLRERTAMAMALLEGAAAAKEVVMENHIPAGLVITGDRLLIGQAIQNLLSNAIKFTPRKGRIVIGGEETGAAFWVEDTGIGIPPERIGGLFDAAQSRSTPGTEQEKGVGFGLPLCREIVEAHGGAIGVVSTPGKGSRFTVTLPLEPPPTDAPA
ncbi:MAG: PAS domain S-box protein [Nitrospinae bacterium]|nr:PAS domain S-box protein [Nitrospinota bacterium]